ncbi:MAG: MMPL family transporter [Deltaproteobacteria bacterium]|nr:MMPL family transporter [Deltaproteobacteria bacterium]
MPHPPKRAHPESWLRYIVHHPGQIILLIALITLIFASHLPALRFETSIYDLTIEDLPETHVYNRFKKTFGCEEIILVVARTKGVFDPATFEQIEKLSLALSKVIGVKRVISLPGIKKTMDITDKWDLADFEGVVSGVDLFQRNLISRDKKTTVITLILEDTKQKDQTIDAVKDLIDGYQDAFSLYQVGMPIVSSALTRFTQQDFLTLPVVTFSLIALILFLFFRNLRGILIPSGTVLIALIWTFGLMAWTGTPLSLLTMIVPVFLIAVGTAYCMYIFPEYRSSIKDAPTPREASIQCFSRLGFPTSLAVITTTIGLASLLVNRVSEIREFALFSCFGILALLILMLSFLPAVVGLLPFPKRWAEHKSDKKRLLDRVLSTIIRLNLRHQKITLPLIAIIALTGGIGMSRIKVETNPVGFFKKDTPVARHFNDIYQDMSGSFPLSVVVDSGEDGYFENPEHLKKIDEIQRFLSSLPGVDKTISFADYLRLVNYATNQYKPESYALPEEPFEIRMLVNSFKTMLGQDMLRRFMSPDFSRANIMLRTHISSSIDFLSTEARIRDYLKENFPDSLSFEVTGFGIVISHSSQLISEGQVKSLGLTLVLVFAIMFLLFMSYKVGIIALLPNCFPIIVSFGVMGWFGIPLSMATSLIASIAIGLAVDDTIHYLVGYNREFKEDLNKERALNKTVRHMGRPIIFTTLTISVGFSVLMFSNFRPTAVFGLLMMITMFSALVADLILLPSLMLHVELVTLWDLLKLKLGKDPQKGIPLFNGLSRTQVHYVLMAGALKVHESGSIIFRKGEISDSMYAIISGEMEVVDLTEDDLKNESMGSKRIISTLSAGDVVGEMGMIRSCERSATVIATKRTELIQINDRMIKRLQWLYPPTAHRFFFNLMAILCDRLENLTNCYLAETVFDRLSGLYTRGFFLTMLEKEIARSRRYKAPLSFFILNLDNLPDLIARYGHRECDRLIAETSRLLKLHTRKEDILCRYDDNQFAGMLAHIDAAQAHALCNRMKLLIGRTLLKINGESNDIEMHFGVSSLAPGSETDMKALVSAAVDALRRNRKADPGTQEDG